MNISYTTPTFVQYDILHGYTINSFIQNVTINDKSVIACLNVNTRQEMSYESVVSALINAKYTPDSVTAITLNYLLTLHEEVLEPEKVKEYQQDYKELQEYRAACKAEAKRAIEYVKENQIGPAWKDL